MYQFTVPSFALFSFFLQQYVAAEPVPVSPRQLGDLSFCFGVNSICDFSINLFQQCQNYLDSNDMPKWYQCICGNGYVAVDEA
jgi:hypothetical protein